MKYVYLAVRYVDLGYHVLSAWGSQAEADAEVEREFLADNTKNPHVERKEYDVEMYTIGVKRK